MSNALSSCSERGPNVFRGPRKRAFVCGAEFGGCEPKDLQFRRFTSAANLEGTTLAFPQPRPQIECEGRLFIRHHVPALANEPVAIEAGDRHAFR